MLVTARTAVTRGGIGRVRGPRCLRWTRRSARVWALALHRALVADMGLLVLCWACEWWALA